MKVDLVWITPNAEAFIAEIARVSNPANQKNPNYAGLIRYLIKNKHFSPFEMANMCVRIETSRAIAAQIIRHRSFSFQEFSQRYSEVNTFEPIEIRKQAIINRQSSDEVFNPYIGMDNVGWGKTSEIIDVFMKQAESLYKEMIDAGVAKEVARMILPLTTQTTIYMNGTVRSWMHYIELRTEEHAQKEHRLIAEQIKHIFLENFPFISEALNWNNETFGE